jgi:hypothetical protein
MLKAIFTALAFVGIYVMLWYLFNKDNGGGVG